MLSSDARASLYWLGCSIGRGSVSESGGGPGCGGGASELLVLVLDEEVDDVEEVVSSGSSLVSLSLVFVLGMSCVVAGTLVGRGGAAIGLRDWRLWMLVYPPRNVEAMFPGLLLIYSLTGR